MAIYNNDRDPNEMDWEKQNMKEYRIIESRPAKYYWEYVVKANSETEALNMVLDGKVEAEETWVDEDEDVDSDFELYPVNDNDE